MWHLYHKSLFLRLEANFTALEPCLARVQVQREQDNDTDTSFSSEKEKTEDRESLVVAVSRVPDTHTRLFGKRMRVYPSRCKLGRLTFVEVAGLRLPSLTLRVVN